MAEAAREGDLHDIARDVFKEHPPSQAELMSSPDLQEKYYSGYLSLAHQRITANPRFRDAYQFSP